MSKQVDNRSFLNSALVAAGCFAARPVCLPTRKKFLVAAANHTGWVLNLFQHLGGDKDFLSLPGIEPCYIGCLACKLVSTSRFVVRQKYIFGRVLICDLIYGSHVISAGFVL
jgi:hypothetical protein